MRIGWGGLLFGGNEQLSAVGDRLSDPMFWVEAGYGVLQGVAASTATRPSFTTSGSATGEIGVAEGSAIGEEVAVTSTVNEASIGQDLAEQANELVKLNGGKNSVTIETSTQKIRYDSAGRSHGGVATPHKQIYNKNIVNGVQRSATRASKNTHPMTQEDLDLVRKFLTSQKK